MIHLECLADALGITRTLSHMFKDAARVETPLFRVFDARGGFLMKYSPPASEAVVAPGAPKAAPLVSAQPQRTSKPDDMVSV